MVRGEAVGGWVVGGCGGGGGGCGFVALAGGLPWSSSLGEVWV